MPHGLWSYSQTLDSAVEVYVRDATTLSITTLSITTFSKTTLSITKLGTMTFSMKINKLRHSAQRHSSLWQSVIMLNVAFKPFVPSIILLSVVMLIIEYHYAERRL